MAIFGKVTGSSFFVRAKEQVDGGIPVGMDIQRQAQSIDFLEEGFHIGFRKRRLAPPVLLAARPARQVRGGEISGFALGRTVEGDFRAADFQMVDVLAPVAGGVLFEDASKSVTNG